MSRFLITYESFDPCNQTDVDVLSGLLAACNAKNEIFHKPEVKITKEDLRSCDALILIRPMTCVALELAKSAKRAGIFLTSFFDDDLIHIVKGPHYEHFHWRGTYGKRVLALTDLLLFENPLLLSEYSPYMKRPRAVLAHSSATDMEKKSAPVKEVADVLHILYAAGPDHSHFFNEIVGPAVSPLAERFPGRFDFTFLGVTPELSFFPESVPVQLIPMIPFTEFTEFLKNGNFHLGLAPLLENSFYQRKGVSKYIDYTLAGALGIYSNCMPYTMAIRHMENGLLLDNDPKNWLEALAYCIEHPNELKRMAESAKSDLAQHYSAAAVANELQTEVPEFFNLPERDKAKPIRLSKKRISRLLFPLRRAWNEKLLPSLSEKRDNFAEQIHTKGFFGAVGHYLKKPFQSNKTDSRRSL